MTRRPYLLSSVLLAIALGASTHTACAQVPPAKSPGSATIEDRVLPLAEQVSQANLIPGFQVAVCTKDGERWDGAFGIADLNTNRPVDRQTRFYIASTTKALTGMAAARLHHRGELNLSGTLAEAFPGVKFPAGYDPASVRVLDLLTHTHGLNQRPIVLRTAYLGNYTADELRGLIQDLPVLPNRDFRYANIGYELTALLMSPETRGWKAVLDREVFVPLSMEHTTANPSTLNEDQIAAPHEIGASGQRRVKHAKFDENIGAAGGHFTTAGDLIRFVQATMSAGQLDGEQVIEPEVIEHVTSELVPQDRQFIIYDRYAWGIGWDIGKYGDLTVVHRPGGFAGYYSNVAFAPDAGVGVAAVGNGGPLGASVLEALNAAIFDDFTGQADASTKLAARLEELKRTASSMAADATGETVRYAERPQRPVASYVGTYSNPHYGQIIVRAANGGLELEWGVIREPIRPLQNSAAFQGNLLGANSNRIFFEFFNQEQAQQLAIDGISGPFTRE